MNKRLRTLLVVLAALILIEGGARLYLRYGASPAFFEQIATQAQMEARFGVQYSTHRYLAYYPNPEYEAAGNRHNELGYRGEDLLQNEDYRKPEGVFRIVLVGDGLVYGDGVVDHHETIPAALQNLINEAGYEEVEVVNAGVPGFTSWESLINIELRVLDIQPDLIIYIPGLSDVPARLVSPADAYRGDNSGYLDNIRAQDLTLWQRSSALRILFTKLGIWPPHPESLWFWRPRAATALDLDLLAGEEVPISELLAQNPPIYCERNLRNAIIVIQRENIPLLIAEPVLNVAFAPNPGIAEMLSQGLSEQLGIMAALAEEKNVPLLTAGDFPPDANLYSSATSLSAAGNHQYAQMIFDILSTGDWLP